MNKNTTILLGAVAIIAIGVGAYVSMSSPANEGFTTQSFRNQYQPTFESDYNYGGNDDGGNGGDVYGKPIVTYNKKTCMVFLDGGGVKGGFSTRNDEGGKCCDVYEEAEKKRVCYSRETGVSVEYEDQAAEEIIIEEDTRYSRR